MLGESVLAAKEKTGSRNDAFPHAKTRVWGLPLDNQNGIGGSSPVTSTSIWRWGHVYAGTASSALDNRYYSNAYGRFMTPDPSRPTNALASPQNWNRYMYVSGDPVNHYDPLGTTTCDANGNNCFDGITVNGDTGQATWYDYNNLLPSLPTATYGDAAYSQAIAQYQQWQNEFNQAQALANGCPFGETRMSNGSCNVAINQTALQVFALINQYNPGGFINVFGASMVAGVGSAILAGSATWALADASWALATNGNTIVLGSGAGYITVANQLGANALNVPTAEWQQLVQSGQAWAYNQAFLDAAIANGSDIILSTNFAQAQEVGGFFLQEIQYLQSLGYVPGPGGWSMIPGKP